MSRAREHISRCKWRYVIGAFALGILMTLAFVPLWMLAQPVNIVANQIATGGGDAAEGQPEATMYEAGYKVENASQLAGDLVDAAYADEGCKTVIDVGYSQGWIDWDALWASGEIDGAILECGYGSDYASQDDWTYAYNVAACERLGIPYGVYLYSYAGNAAQANSEADHILRLVSGHNPTLGVYIDVEEGGLEYYYYECASIVCQRVQDAGYVAGWYSGAYNATSTGLGNLPYNAWVADYTPPLNYSGPLTAWQYTNSGVWGWDTNYWYDFPEAAQPEVALDTSAYYCAAYYEAAYPDLQAAFGDDEAAYYVHFLAYGMSEGRQASPAFDPAWYRASNADLSAAFGDDWASYYIHFADYGVSEGRQGAEGFNVRNYGWRYSDLQAAFGNDWASYYVHFNANGYAEGRSFGGTDPRTDPLSAEVDAVTALGGVDYAPVYDWRYYVERNPDVLAAFDGDPVGTLEHFVAYGMREGRQGSEDFDPYAYLETYADLRAAFGFQQYYIHYLDYGLAEGRAA